MNSDIFLGLVNNAALLLALVVLYDTLPIQKIRHYQRQEIIIGVCVGLIGVTIMLTPWRLADGIVFDTRSILLSLIGFFFGPIPALIAAGMTSALRLFQGGEGAITGVCVILTATGLGLVWRHLTQTKKTEPRWYEFYAFGVIVHIATLLWFLTLPSAFAVLRVIALPMILIHPFGAVLLGLLLTRQRQRNQWELALREERDLLARISDTSLDAILLTSPTGDIQAANPAACRMFGRSEQEIIEVGHNGLVDTADPRLRLALEERARHRRFRGELTFVRKNGEKFPGEIASALFKDQNGRDRVSMIIRDITERRQMENALFLMSETQTKIAQLNSVEEILQLVGEKAQSLIGEGQTILTFVDEATQETGIIGMHGFDPAFHKLSLSFGYDPTQMKFPLQEMTPEELQSFRSHRLQKFEGGLYDLLVRQVPRPICAAMEEYLQIAAIYTIGFAWDDIDYGGLVILARYDLTPLQDMIETIAAQASIAIRRIRSEEILSESNEYRQNVFASLQDGLSVVDRAGRHIEVNQSLLAMLGMSSEEMLGVGPPHLYWPPEEVDTIQKAFDQTLRGEMDNFELIFRRKNGERFPVIVSPSPIKNKEGEIIRYVATVKDISERKEAERQLAESEQRYRLVAEGMADVVWVLNATDQRFSYISPSVEKLRGYTPEEIYNLPLKATVTPESFTKVAALMQSRIVEFWGGNGRRASYVDEVEQPHKDGRIIQAEINTTYLLNERGELEIIGVSRDITERKRVETQLQQQERLAAVGQLAAGIAHDFNNIMAVIILYTQRMGESDDLPGHHREGLAVVNQQAWHASQLVDQILDFSRRAILEQRPLNILPLCKEQFKLWQRALPENIDLTLRHEQDDYSVHADPTRIQQMLTNLVVNARDAMPDGGALVISLEHITLEQDQPPPLPQMLPGEWIQLTVSDTGTGISPDALPYIFEPFFTAKERGQGSGLGLAQVYGIVGQHGGHIGVETEVGHGAAFTAYLPAITAQPAPPPAAEPATDTPKGRGELLLVVEDGEILRKALQETLEALNYRVWEAANGAEALAIMESRGDQVALILSDVVMPVLGGIAMLQTLRQTGWQTPVVMLTGHVINKAHEELSAQEVTDWLTKPPTMTQLAQTVAAALNRQATAV